jgi:hypothetical protein
LNHFSQNAKALDALEVYASNQPIPTLDSGTLSTVRMIALSVLALPNLTKAQHYSQWASLRNILLQMVRFHVLLFFNLKPDICVGI